MSVAKWKHADSRAAAEHLAIGKTAGGRSFCVIELALREATASTSDKDSSSRIDNRLGGKGSNLRIDSAGNTHNLSKRGDTHNRKGMSMHTVRSRRSKGSHSHS